MLRMLKSMFRAEKETAKLPVPGMCLIDIQLAGKTHTFFQQASFGEQLAATLPVGGFFEFQTPKGGYIINLDFADYLKVSEDAFKIDGGDPEGCSIWLEGRDKSIKLGAVDQTFEHVCRSVKEENFINVGRHSFNRDRVALIVFH